MGDKVIECHCFPDEVCKACHPEMYRAECQCESGCQCCYKDPNHPTFRVSEEKLMQIQSLVIKILEGEVPYSMNMLEMANICRTNTIIHCQDLMEHLNDIFAGEEP